MVTGWVPWFGSIGMLCACGILPAGRVWDLELWGKSIYANAAIAVWAFMGMVSESKWNAGMRYALICHME